MLRRTPPGPFRGVPSTTAAGGGLWNVADFVFAGGASAGLTNGNAAVDQIVLPQAGIETFRWKAVSIAFSAQLSIASSNQLPSQAYGRLGKIYCGLTTNGPATGDPTSNLAAAYGPPPPFPADTSLLASLWDPAVDPLPPQSFYQIVGIGPLSIFFTQKGFLNVGAVVTFPQPIPLFSDIFAGIWLQPSLVSNHSLAPDAGLCVFNAQYNLTYDDGE